MGGHQRYHIYANQCRVLENVLQRYDIYQDQVHGEFASVFARYGILQDHLLENFLERERERERDKKFPRSTYLYCRAEQLLVECSAANPNLWLLFKRGDKKQDFSLLLQEFFEYAYTIRDITRKYTRNSSSTSDIQGLLHFLQSARKHLHRAAALDHCDLLARLDNIIESPSDHEEDDMDRAQILKRVFSAHTKEAQKEARRINPEDLEYGNTLGRGRDAKVVAASWKGMSGFVVKENRVRCYHNKEVDAMLGMSHPNVIRMIGHSSEEPSEEGINERSVLLMEQMDGDLDGFLSQLSQKGPELPLDYNIDLLLQIVRGIKYLHGKKIVHRDLKPANILFAKQGDLITLKIADFGCSRSPFDHRTMATAPIGTDMYMAPELLCARGNRDVDSSMYGPEVDIYSFAMICYKVLTGDDPHLAWRDVLEGKRPPLKASARCPQALLSFIQKCWDKDPDQRPSASQVYDFLILLKFLGLLTMPAHETSCLSYGITDALLEKLVSFLGKEWLETEARALGEGTSEEDRKLHKQVTDFLSRLSNRSRIQQIWNWLPFL